MSNVSVIGRASNVSGRVGWGGRSFDATTMGGARGVSVDRPYISDADCRVMDAAFDEARVEDCLFPVEKEDSGTEKILGGLE